MSHGFFEVTGFKSIRDTVRVELPGLTIIAGANSTGKSSLVQPLLLLKQTILSEFQPEDLKLSGPNVTLSDAAQAFWHGYKLPVDRRFSIRYSGNDINVCLNYSYASQTTIRLDSTMISGRHMEGEFTLTETMQQKMLLSYMREIGSGYALDGPFKFEVRRGRAGHFIQANSSSGYGFEFHDPAAPFKQILSEIIHLPGLRGNPERTYKRSGLGPVFPGHFQDYFATILDSWRGDSGGKRSAVTLDLKKLGLGWKIETKTLDAVSIELKVTRLSESVKGGSKDMVSLADTGIGVSQALPVLTALHAAAVGQIVIVEQPEIHLHPKAQQAMAEVLISAVNRGVVLIVETHSEVFIESVLSLVANGHVDPEAIKLYWAERDREGASIVASSDISPDGKTGTQYPMDFAEVRMHVLKQRLFPRKRDTKR